MKKKGCKERRDVCMGVKVTMAAAHRTLPTRIPGFTDSTNHLEYGTLFTRESNYGVYWKTNFVSNDQYTE